MSSVSPLHTSAGGQVDAVLDEHGRLIRQRRKGAGAVLTVDLGNGTATHLTAAGLEAILQDTEKLELVRRCVSNFREFLAVWQFYDQETRTWRTLGDQLWEGQELAAEAMTNHKGIYALKARKLGFTCLATAYDAWVMRFRGAGERVHVFSRRQNAANEIRRAVQDGLERLPEWMRLPISGTTTEIRYAGSLLVSYPADETTSVEATCTHAHLDEFAHAGNPERIWQSILPTVAGSLAVVTTGAGPESYSAELFRDSLAGDVRLRDGSELKAIFAPATARLGRNEAWLEQTRKSMSSRAFLQEYPMTWEDAISGSAVHVFPTDKIDKMNRYARYGTGHPKCWPPGVAVKGRKYVQAVDVGQVDATVIVTLDVTETGYTSVAGYERHRGLTFPEIYALVEREYRKFPGPMRIEVTGGHGASVADSVNVPVERFSTSRMSKPRIIDNLCGVIQGEELKADHEAFPQLIHELRAYTQPDTYVTQDSVMALALAVDFDMNRPRGGTILGVILF